MMVHNTDRLIGRTILLKLTTLKSDVLTAALILELVLQAFGLKTVNGFVVQINIDGPLFVLVLVTPNRLTNNLSPLSSSTNQYV